MKSLQNYKPIEEVQKQFSFIFPTVDSVRWLVRTHREFLIERDAILFITGRILFDIQKFENVVIEIGLEAAKKSEKLHRQK